jgi:hypothetical protein
VCLRNADLKIKTTHNCYLTHPYRNEDTDDVLLDSANQLELSRKDLVGWVISERSWTFIDTEPEPEISDFFDEFSKLCA